MHSIDIYLAILNADKCLFDAAFAHAEGLYFSPMQGNAGLIVLQNEIIMVCLLIIGYHLTIRLRHLPTLLHLQSQNQWS